MIITTRDLSLCGSCYSVATGEADNTDGCERCLSLPEPSPGGLLQCHGCRVDRDGICETHREAGRLARRSRGYGRACGHASGIRQYTSGPGAAAWAVAAVKPEHECCAHGDGDCDIEPCDEPCPGGCTGDADHTCWEHLSPSECPGCDQDLEGEPEYHYGTCDGCDDGMYADVIDCVASLRAIDVCDYRPAVLAEVARIRAYSARTPRERGYLARATRWVMREYRHAREADARPS